MSVSSLRTPAYPTQNANGVPIRRSLLVLLVSTIILSPRFAVSAGMYQPRGEDLVLVVFLGIWIPVILANRQNMPISPPKKISGDPRISVILYGMFYMAVISIGVGTIIFQQSLVLNDLMILPMIVRYWLTFQIGRSIKQPIERYILLWALLISMGISAGVGILQHFNLIGINDWLTPHYVFPHMELGGLEAVKAGLSFARVVGTNGDPRHYAYILVVGIALCLAILLNLQKNKQARIMAFVVMGLCFVGINFSASRTGVLSVMALISVAAFVQGQGFKGMIGLFGILFAIGAALVLFSYSVDIPILSERVTNLDNRSFDKSYNARERDLLAPFQDAQENPTIWVTGRGPSKAAIRTDSHDDYGWYFLRFGIPGLWLYLLLLFRSFRLNFRMSREETDPINLTIITLTLLVVVNWFIYAWAENIFKDPQLMSLNMLLIGAASGIGQAEH